MKRLVAPVTFLWFAAIFAAYFALFPPFALLAGLPLVKKLSVTGEFLSPLLILVFIVISANGWGSLFWHRSHLARLEKFVFATGFGLGFFSIVVFIAGLIGVTGKLFYFTLLLTGALMFLSAAKHSRGRYSHYMNTWMIFAFFPLVSSFIGALAPPTQFDSLVYHLALPSEYLKAGRFLRVEHNIFFSFPQGLEMLFQMGLSLDGDSLANLLHWLFLPLTAFALLAFSRRFFSIKAGLLACAIWLYTPAALFIATGTYVDLGLAFYIFLAFYAAAMWHVSGHKIWIISAGIFSGLALGAKYTAAPAVAAVMIASFLFGRKDFASLKNILLVFSPWLIKNYLFLGNPIAPWGASFFSSPEAAGFSASVYFEHIRNHGIGALTIKDFILLPWNLTAYGFKYGGAFDILGPAFLLFMPLLFLKDKIDRITKSILLFSALYFISWFFTGKVLRFLIPLLPFACLIAARGLELFQISRSTKIISYAALAMVFVHNLLVFHWVMAPIDPYAVVLGNQTKTSYLSSKLNYYYAAYSCLNLLPPGSKAAFLGETRSYFVKCDKIAPTVFDRNPLADWANASQDPDEFTQTLRENGVTHIFENNYESKRLSSYSSFTPRGLSNLSTVKEKLSKSVYKDAYCSVYEIPG